MAHLTMIFAAALLFAHKGLVVLAAHKVLFAAAPTVTVLKLTGNLLKLGVVSDNTGTGFVITGAQLAALMNAGTVPAAVTGPLPTSPIGPPINNLASAPLYNLVNPVGGYASAAAAQAAFNRDLKIIIQQTLAASSAPVAPAAQTSVAVVAANAVTPANVAYTQADQTTIANLANSEKTQLNAAIADITSLYTAMATLLSNAVGAVTVLATSAGAALPAGIAVTIPPAILNFEISMWFDHTLVN